VIIKYESNVWRATTVRRTKLIWNSWWYVNILDSGPIIYLGVSTCITSVFNKKRESILFIFNDKCTRSCICLRLDLYMSHVKITCATADCFCFLCSPTPSTTRFHTCAYVTRMKNNVSRSFELRHVIPDTRISSGQCPRCDVTNVICGTRDFQGHKK
jgi:hypothetical protein